LDEYQKKRPMEKAICKSLILKGATNLCLGMFDWRWKRQSESPVFA
jgi:hypothetical protein